MEQGIAELILYGVNKQLIDERDIVYITNRLLNYLKLNSLDYDGEVDNLQLFEILEKLTNKVIEEGVIENTPSAVDCWQSSLMDIITPSPSCVTNKFYELYRKDLRKATDYFYQLSIATNYIRKDRMDLDKKWKYQTEYGDLDITINLSKPEKDPKEIARALKERTFTYPKCLLCKENEGYAGRINHPARSQHRLIPLTLANEDYFMQYSPYVYYTEHCIIFNAKHKAMKIDKKCFSALLDFVDFLPHYFVGSNADLPIVGGSILTHDHFQGGNFNFAMERAKLLDTYQSKKYPSVNYGRVNWPMSVVRVEGANKEEILNFAETVLNAWIEYSDESVNITAFSEQERHNTITPVVRKKGEVYEVDLVLRNNRTTSEYPDGIFHPHKEWHAIKKENIGLIEVMGLAILPSRLLNDLTELKHSWLQGVLELEDKHMEKYQSWYEMIREKYSLIDEHTIDSVIEDEVGDVFLHVLEDAGVYKQTAFGQERFIKFLEGIER